MRTFLKISIKFLIIIQNIMNISLYTQYINFLIKYYQKS
jgi:hypothetical protein